MKKSYLLAGLVLLAASPAFAQTKIGAAGAPDGSAMLEVTSGTANNKGLLLPRMTTTQRNAIASPAKGLMIYNTTTNQAEINNGTPALPVWAATATTGAAWTTNGNTGTNPATDFIGTTDNQPLTIRTNNTEQIHVTAAGYVGVGTTAPIAKLNIVDTGKAYIVVGSSTGSMSSVSLGNGHHSMSRNLTSSGGGVNDVALYTTSGGGAPVSLYLAAKPAISDSIPLDQFVLKQTGNVGIGIKDPLAKLHVNDGNLTITNNAPISSSAINVISDNGGTLNPDNISITAYGTSNAVFGTSTARGTAAAPLNSQAGDNTGNLWFAPRINGAFSEITKINTVYLGDGTTSKSRLGIFTSGALAVSVDSSGFVGIGVATPQQTLHVAGTARITGSSGTATTIAGRNAAGDVSNVAVGTGLSFTGGTLTATAGGNNWGLTGNAGSNPATNFIGTTDNQAIAIRTNNTEQIRVTAAGYIGVGTTAPIAKLTVVDTGKAYMVVGSSTGGMSSVSLGNGHHSMSRNLTSSGGGVNDVALYTTSGSSPASLYLAAKPAISDSIPLNQFVLKSNGNVGIGVTVPKAKLQVQGGIVLRNDVNIAHGNGTFLTWSTVRSGVGETEFVNYRGTGAGGFRFYDVNPGGSIDTAVYNTNNIAFIAPNTGAYSNVSDMRVKTNVNIINDGLEKVMAMRPVSYDFHTGRTLKDGVVTFTENDKTINTIGFLAQELAKVVPEAVVIPKDPTNELYTVSYATVIPVLTKAIQEQQQIIETLKAELVSVKTDNTALKADVSKIGALSEKMKQLEALLGTTISANTTASK